MNFGGLFIRKFEFLTVIAQPVIRPLASSGVRALDDRVRRTVLDLYLHAPTLMSHMVARQTAPKRRTFQDRSADSVAYY